MTEANSSRHAWLAAVISALMIAQQVAGKAARDALFLSSFHTAKLPLAMAGGAVLSLLAVWWLSKVMARYSPGVLSPILFSINGAAFAGEWLLLGRDEHAAAVLLYLHTALFGPVTISTFWSGINERFDPHTAKSVVARIAGGGTLGGVLGGLASWRASLLVEPRTMLLFLCLANVLAAAGGASIAHSERAPSSTPPDAAFTARPLSSLMVVRNAPFLRNLAILVALGAATSALLDYIFSSMAVSRFGSGQALLSFFSLFWLSVGVVSFLLQMSLGRVALEKLGLAVNIAVLPGIILFGGALGLAMPGLVSAALLRGGEAVQRNTLFRSAYELMYAPLAEEQKRAAKALIDIGFDRVGTVVGSGIALIALHVFSSHQSSLLLASVIVLALATLPVTRQLHLGYVDALQQSLRDEAARLNQPSAGDRLTRINSVVPAEREDFIERLEELQPGGLTSLLDAAATGTLTSEATEPAPESRADAQLIAITQDILSGDASRTERALGSIAGPHPAVACAILLLGRSEFHDRARTALRRIAPSITGQLIDALLDPGMGFDVHRRLPSILSLCSPQRAVEGLLLGLTNERFEVRYACGLSLFRLTDAQKQVVVSQEKTIAAIQREINGAERLLNDTLSEEERDPSEQSRLILGLKLDRVNRTLEHVFHILCLHLDREPLRIAFRALHHDDEKFRGTALEYLSTVLPEEIRQRVWPFLSESAPLISARIPGELLADLERIDDTRVPAS